MATRGRCDHICAPGGLDSKAFQPKPRQHQPLGGVCTKMLVSIPYSNSEHETCDAANCRSRSGQNLEAREGERREEMKRGKREESTRRDVLQQSGADLCQRGWCPVHLSRKGVYLGRQPCLRAEPCKIGPSALLPEGMARLKSETGGQARGDRGESLRGRQELQKQAPEALPAGQRQDHDCRCFLTAPSSAQPRMVGK